MASEEGVIGEVKRLRVELLEKLHELEERIRRLEDIVSPSKLIAINWRIAHVEAFAHRILSLSKNTLTSVPEIERDLRDYFSDLGDLAKLIEREIGSVDWDLIRSCTFVVMRAARTAGLPFRTIASIAIEKLGGLAVEAIDENAVKEVYGFVDWDYWRSLAAKLKKP
ncbi:MAG: hypothetical protein QXW02_01415 [Nitrososphaerota archaeon]